MTTNIREHPPWRVLGVAAVAALLLAGCGITSAVTVKSSGGGVVTYAEAPSSPPNYIFPLIPGEFLGNNNLYQFSNIMYLPLYWFGKNGEPVFNKGLSVANPPVFSDNNTMITITLKHWVWSNGQPITARDVIFWMNLLTAATDPNAPAVGSNSAPGPGWGGGVDGEFPENVVSYAQTGTYTVVFHLNASYNPTWYLYNELSEIYPMPQKSWDKLSATGSVGNYDASAQSRVVLTGTSAASLPTICTSAAPCYVPSKPGTATTGALGVAQFLNTQSQDLVTYTNNPLWKVVDGPFKLSQFTTSGFVKLVPSKEYSGSPKPTISAFEELPFTTDTAEFNALETGSLTIGYIPSQDLNVRKSLEKSEGYSFSPWYDYGFTMARYNFTNPTVGPILSQLYFRQAMQSLINQPEYVKEFDDDVGTITNGPVPTYPPGNPDESPLEAKGSVYPYDPTKAVKLLKDNGWTVVPGGSSYCSKPGTGPSECGADIRKGETADLTELYASGIVELTDEMTALQSSFSQVAGIKLQLNPAPFSVVISTTHGHCTFAHPCSDWEIGADGAGWTYGPDFLPTGDELFLPGAGPNLGDYVSATDDANIEATITDKTKKAETAALFQYEDYLARQLPDQYLPTLPLQFTMYKSKLKGLVPQDVFDIIYPQDYRLG
jgi:peptide/nickel transport system substrate-binding protein